MGVGFTDNTVSGCWYLSEKHTEWVFVFPRETRPVNVVFCERITLYRCRCLTEKQTQLMLDFTTEAPHAVPLLLPPLK